MALFREKFLLEEFLKEMVFQMPEDRKSVPLAKYEKIVNKYANHIKGLGKNDA